MNLRRFPLLLLGNLPAVRRRSRKRIGGSGTRRRSLPALRAAEPQDLVAGPMRFANFFTPSEPSRYSGRQSRKTSLLDRWGLPISSHLQGLPANRDGRAARPRCWTDAVCQFLHTFRAFPLLGAGEPQDLAAGSMGFANFFTPSEPSPYCARKSRKGPAAELVGVAYFSPLR
jgi:hypothetical protein